MYEDSKNISFAQEYPVEWEEIKSSGQGLIISENGVFNYINILTSNEFELGHDENSLVTREGDWYIISYISPGTQNGRLFVNGIFDRLSSIIKRNFFIYLMILTLTFILSLFIINSKIEKNRIKYFSEFDAMTGVYNRRAGFEKLNTLFKGLPKQNCKISICFIDINGLKEVNDHLGHEAGDELIISVINGVKQNIRDNDFISRLGGDEFLIIFENMAMENAETIWTRIAQEYESINSSENRKYLISASHGIETMNCMANIDEVINRADEKMYIEKREIKKNLRIIRQ